jgi:hypothetical protein
MTPDRAVLSSSFRNPIRIVGQMFNGSDGVVDALSFCAKFLNYAIGVHRPSTRQSYHAVLSAHFTCQGLMPFLRHQFQALLVEKRNE